MTPLDPEPCSLGVFPSTPSRATIKVAYSKSTPMEKAFGTALAPAPTRKGTARAALVDLKESARFLLTECFRQFGIETVMVSSSAAERLHLEKFEACVLNLGPGADAVMEAARTSPSNSRIVLYGLGGSAHEAMRYSKNSPLCAGTDHDRGPARQPRRPPPECIQHRYQLRRHVVEEL